MSPPTVSPAPAPLAGKVAIVTGAGQGVGRATALHLASMGASIAVNDVDAAAADAVVGELVSTGVTAVAAVADVTDFDQVGVAVAMTISELGRIDILVNNAGNVGTDPSGWTLDRFWETGPEQWRSFIDVNLYGVLNFSRQVIPALIEQGAGGRLITVVSDAARIGEPRLEVYAAAKAGAAGFMRSIAKSVARYDITANSIALGTMAGPHYDAMEPAALAERLKAYLVRRPGRAEEAAALIGHLAGPSGAWITGQTYPLNGGISTS